MALTILSRIPGDVIAQAIRTLPPAETAGIDATTVEVEVAHVGRVRIALVRMKHRNGRSTHWFWTADSAELV